MSRMCWRKLKEFYYRHHKPKHLIPSASPLSPCTIEPYTWIDGKYEENKGYIPVSLLLKAIDNDDMLNIAVAGNYGVGKSSVINTAEKRQRKWFFPKHRFIKISLASLLTLENKQRKKEENKQIHQKEESVENGRTAAAEFSFDSGVTDKQIEYSILQQILYHDRPQKTPKSRIQRIHRTRRYKPYWIALLCILVFASLLLLVKPSWFKLSDYYKIDNAGEYVKAAFKWGPIVILWFVYILVCRYISRHCTFSLARVGYKDIEMKVKEDISIFNAFMDEIVYFFESTKYDVVVFEDIDRFENREIIFYKLRELNTILNNSKSIKRRINFVYAVLDDMFDSTERVKFFDYIITVIPVINSLNSYNKLKEYIQPQELLDKLGGNELLNLCDYIQDMRLLLNIVNEFNQFVPLLDTSVMSERILFGLIVYKNYVPSDFSLMYNKEGVVATAIENVDKFRKDLIDDKKQVVEELKDEISKIEDEQNNRIIQLRMSLLEKGHKLSDYSNSNLRIYIDGELHSFDGVAKSQSLFEKLRKGEANFIINGGTRTDIPSFSTIEKDMGGIGYYDSKIDLIRKDCSNRILAIEQRIQSAQSEIKSMPSSVHGIYQASPDLLEEDLSPLNDELKIQLVKFLILNGYLDRHYQYYISYFYPNALKREDRNFVMRAARHEGKQYDVKLDRMDEVLKRFIPDDFENNASLLNVDLVREIYNNQKYSSYCHSVCKLISSLKDLDFIHLAYKSVPPIKNSFFYQLLQTYDYWDEITNYDNDKQDDLREAYIRFCDVRKPNDAFKEWLICNYAFLDKRWDVITTKLMIERIFKAYTPVFRDLKLTHTPDHLLSDIIKNQRYDFSRRNFSAIVRKLGFYEQYSSASYTALLDVKISALLQMVEKNWAKAFKIVFPDTSIWETDSTLVEILNKPSISLPEARNYISKQHSRVEHACQLNDEILNYAFENSLVKATWLNVYHYVQKKNCLPLTFLCKNSIRGKVSDSLSKQEEDNLCRLVVFSNDVNKSKYEELVPLFTTPFEQILNPVSLRRMEFLIENNLLMFNDKNYKFIKDNYPVLSSAFLSMNVDKFMLSPNMYCINSADVVASLKTMNVKKAQCDFIRSIANADFVPESELVSLVRPFLINGDLKVGEIGFRLLICIMSTSDSDIRVLLGRRAILSLPYDKDNTTALLKSMGNEYRRLISDSSTSTISYNRDAILVANALVKNGYIESYEKRGSKIVINKR